jgi:exodeoxyribonuclease VII large subunit
LRQIREAMGRLRAAIVRDFTGRRTLLSHIAARVVSPRDRLREQAQRCDDLFLRLERALRVRLEKRRSGVEHLAGKLDALSPLKVLERGYSIVREANEKGRVIKSAQEIQSGQELQIRFHDGEKTVHAT